MPWTSGGAPEPFLNLDQATCQACPPLNYSDQGYCSHCPFGEVPRGDHCEACAPGSVPVASTNSCSSCGKYEITVGNDCVACPIGQVADRPTNTCVACPADLVVDIATFSGCSGQTYMTNVTPSVGDACAEDFWIDVINLDSLLPPPASSCTSVYVSAGLSGLTEAECPQHRATLEVLEPSFVPLFGAANPGTWQPPPPLGVGRCDFGTATTIDEVTIASGVTNVRIGAAAFKMSVAGDTPVPIEVVIDKSGEEVD
jgi:hypothetical protein